MASYPSGLRDRFAKPSFAGSNPADASPVARVVELVDTADLKSVVRMDVGVRVPPWVLLFLTVLNLYRYKCVTNHGKKTSKTS